MQLTKDDFITTRTGLITGIKYSKFKQVVEFYEKYKELRYKDANSKDKTRYELLNLWTKSEEWEEDPSTDCYRNWLFNYCFKDGLK